MQIRFTHILAILFIIGGLIPIQSACAQSGGRIEIIRIDSQSFPALSLQFEAFDEQNLFIPDLQASQVRLLEDEAAIPLREMELIQPGVHFIAAFNLGPELSNRFAGVSRFETLQSALLGWAQSQPAETFDQFSLAANNGMQLIRGESPADWITGLAGFQPDLLAETPNLNSLTRAIDLATDANPDSQQKNAILWITPLIFSLNLDALSNLAERAASLGVPINVWLTASESTPSSSPQIFQALENLAATTGGQFFLYTGQQGLPNPDTFLDPLRYAYRAVVDSQINASGAHTLQVEVDYSGVVLTSTSKEISINVEPPNPIFLSPPTQIERVWSKVEDQQESRLLPQVLSLKVLVEYPDGHQRDLKSSRLYVNGSLTVENASPPFDTFDLDLTNFTTDGHLNLRVEVEDVLGLSKSSIEMPVDLMVEPQKALPLRAALTTERLLTFGGILAAGLVLILALVLTGRQAQRRWRIRHKRVDSDPLTQPVPARIEPPSQPRNHHTRPAVGRATQPRAASAELATAKAWLVRVADNGSAAAEKRNSISPPLNPASAIPLIRRDTTIGSDARRALYRLDATTISGLHARIQHTSEGEYRIFDSGSVAGTWVNYAPVPSQGLLLKHGDLVQIGRVAFRFQVANPPAEAQLRIETFEYPA